MGIFGKKKNPPQPPAAVSRRTLLEDIPIAASWIVKALNSSGYQADYTLESMRELDRFFDEQSGPGGILSRNRGQILFGLGSYVGETAIRLWGGRWLTDDSDPEGEVNIAVELDGTILVEGVEQLKGTEPRVIPDRVAAAARSTAGSTTPVTGAALSRRSSSRQLALTVPQAMTTALRSKPERKRMSCRAYCSSVSRLRLP